MDILHAKVIAIFSLNSSLEKSFSVIIISIIFLMESVIYLGFNHFGCFRITTEFCPNSSKKMPTLLIISFLSLSSKNSLEVNSNFIGTKTSVISLVSSPSFFL